MDFDKALLLISVLERAVGGVTNIIAARRAGVTVEQLEDMVAHQAQIEREHAALDLRSPEARALTPEG